MYSSDYNPKSCSVEQKPFYHPIEAALRWCGLINHEEKILTKTSETHRIKPSDFPMWPCLKNNFDKILYAIENKEINHGRDGITVHPDEHVAIARLTVTHSDLKEWMIKSYPDQKPSFLFDEMERKAHAAISSEAYLALQAELEAKKAEILRLQERLRTLQADDERKGYQIQSMEKMIAAQPKAESTADLLIIGAIIGASQKKKTASGQDGRGVQTALVNLITEHYPKVSGLSKSQLDRRFAAANALLQQSLE